MRSTNRFTDAPVHKKKVQTNSKICLSHVRNHPILTGEPKIPSCHTVLESLNLALHRRLSDNKHVYLLGEDVLDPYGGAFKVTRGLSTKFPDRVITTPISEAGFVGVAAGMALRGLRPVVEIMFGDFTTLIADQMINHIAKFRWMYNRSGNSFPW